MSHLECKLPKNLLSPMIVVCHDAGAANHIFAWLNAWEVNGSIRNHDIRLVLDGPAKILWLKSLNKSRNINIYNDFKSAFKDAKSVLTGTGWASTLEYDAIKLASNMKMKSIAVIDHWVNYNQRFIRNNIEVLPGSIWVTDSDAFSIASEKFKEIEIHLMPNLYLKNMVAEIKIISKDCYNLLYVLEPVRNDWGKGVPGEFQALDYFVSKIKKITGQYPFNLILRPHPSEDSFKYHEWILKNSIINPILDSNKNLAESISNARWVVGVETYAMIVALAANRITWSSLPPWANRCNLPHKSINFLRDINY
jgi:hypothetical protein